MPGRANVGWVLLQTTDPPLRVNARLSDEQPKVESGYGGWEEVPRPRRPPITTFKGLPALRMTLPILLDEWVSGKSIEKQIGDLSLMGRAVGSDGEPPTVKVTATGGAIPYQGRKWVVSDLTFGDALMNDAGDRVRQQVTISLLEYVEDLYLTQKSVAAQQRTKQASAKTKSGSSKKRVTLPKKGRTASSAAASGEPARRWCGSPRWSSGTRAAGSRSPT
jgi:hypothetical protein